MAENSETAGTVSPGGGPTFPARIIASLLELSERRLQQLVAEGWIPRAERGHYSLRDSVRGYIRYLKQNAQQQTRGTEGARLSRAQAVKVELENFQRMGELAVWTQVDDTMNGLIVTMRSAHEGLPGRLASEFASISEPPRIYQRLQAELRSILEQCANYLEKRAEYFVALPAPSEEPSPADPPDTDDLGGPKPDHAP
jgi:phage terminase Nu1 subunit (DNA packaging protein)